MRPLTRKEKMRAAECVAAAWDLRKALLEEDPDRDMATVDEDDGFWSFKVSGIRRRQQDVRKLLKLCGGDREILAMALPRIRMIAKDRRSWLKGRKQDTLKPLNSAALANIISSS